MSFYFGLMTCIYSRKYTFIYNNIFPTNIVIKMISVESVYS